VFTDHGSPVTNHRPPCLVVDLGLIGYAPACDLQKRVVAARKGGAIEDVLLLCSHRHVITLGRNGKRENLLASDRVLQQKGVEFHATDRGGDITYHGPGQIVGYPILNLAAIRRDVGWYVRMLEETMIRATSDYGITAARESGQAGIWVACDTEKKPSAPRTPSSRSQEQWEQTTTASSQKLGAIGVHLSRWVTSHGFAYNVSTDLRYFDLIVPCGIAERKAISLEKLLGRRVDENEASARLVRHFAEIFGLNPIHASFPDLLGRLERFEHVRDFEHRAAVSA
jgi:lipoyl(octanoyl) transferase